MSDAAPKLKTIFSNGIVKENPALRMILGCCPALAVTTSCENGIGMGLATTAVLMFSNLAISLMRNVIPDKVRIPSYIVLISGFVSIVMYLLKAYLPDLDRSLGIYIPLIVVNCILLARAEMFASKNKPLASFVDGVAMGIGFTLALFAISSVRELTGNGTWFGIAVTKDLFPAAVLMVLPPGGFLAFAVVITAMNRFARQKIETAGCASCEPSEPHCAPSEGGRS